MQRRAYEKFMDVVSCSHCHGARLNPQARSVTLKTGAARFNAARGLTLPEVCSLPVCDAEEFFAHIDLDDTSWKIADEALKEIRGRLHFLSDVGLDYLTLSRTAPTLSGGEMQRIRLAGQIGCGLVGVLYILDEPSIGLHARDNGRLLDTLARLRDQGNTVIVVEHDEDTIRAADHVVDFGPGPGVRGGKVVAAGPVGDLLQQSRSLTGQFLSGKRKIQVPASRRKPNGNWLAVRGATHNNLKNVDVEIPLGTFVCVTGVSGSGKSSLVNDILIETLRRDLNAGSGVPGAHREIEGLEHLDKMIAIDQSPIGRTPRSNPATYIKLLDDIRDLYTQLPDAKTRGYKPGRFSFNVAGGRCEACEGNGSNKLEMDFLADIWVTCPICEGHRFNRETLQVRFKGKSIAQVLEMDVQEALEHFENIPKVHHKLQTLHDVGLDYMKLGQPSPTLSGGEAQRVKLARELVKISTGRTLYLLDEPTTGLHFADIELLLKVLHGFVEAGNTVLVVEHNLEVVKTADWIIDLGPEGGNAGGLVVACGTPEDVAEVKDSHTGRALRPALSLPVEGCTKAAGSSSARRVPLAKSIKVRGATQHNLKNVSVEIPRDQITVCCGPSGSGKTSLAMDTIYAEGQRRYVESLSSYARQFVGQMQKPRVEHIEGLSPAIAIEQKHAGQSPRSTVGTVTEVYDYLRILTARLGEPYCPACDKPIGTQSTDEIVGKVMAHPAGTKAFLMAPVEIQVGEKYETLWEEMRASGYIRVRIDGQTCSLDDVPLIDRRRHHQIEVVVDRIVVRPDARSRIAEGIENALSLGKGVFHLAFPDTNRSEPEWEVEVHSQHFACDACGRSFEPLSPHNFSFNSSLGWCPACEGLGVQTGANPAALLRSSKATLAEGAVAIWPSVNGKIFPFMLDALARATGIPTSVPFDQLGAKHRRLLMHGTGDRWFDVHVSPAGASEPFAEAVSHQGEKARPVFRYQYKGLYPALDEASHVSPAFRSRLEHLVDEVECSLCNGSRLRDDAAAVQLRGRTIDELCRMPLGRLLAWVNDWTPDAAERQVAGELIREIRNRVQFLVDVGLDYLTLSRPAPSLSGGEMQRIRLAAQVGSGLCGVLYVLDEPTIGLHARDNKRLLAALKRLRDLGNTLLVVEHDREVVKGADRLLDFGPAAGRLGGEIVAQGTPAEVARRRNSVTGPYLSGKKAIPVPSNRRMESARGKGGQALPPRPPGGSWLEVCGARHNNLQNITARIPLGTFTVVTGPSGSGKSSLVNDVLYGALARLLHRAKVAPAAHDEILGIEQINKVIRVDQQPLGQTPTSNPATFTGVFEHIRTLFAQLPEAKLRGYSPRRFSFNVAGGRCEKCEGNGQLKIEMHFLPDVWVECDDCRGRRYEPETLTVRYHGQSIADVLDMSCGQALQLFKNIPRIRRILQTLCDVGLDYITLGQSAPTLSGGEAQRVKLAAELSRPDTGRTLYLLDEPTTGLHFEDLAKLLDVLNRLVDLGNTVVVIEHNLDVVKTADWVLDMGPEAGDEGGRIVVAGTPEDVVAHARTANRPGGNGVTAIARSYTGEVLEPVLKAGPHLKRAIHDFAAEEEKQEGDLETVSGETATPAAGTAASWPTSSSASRTPTASAKPIGTTAASLRFADSKNPTVGSSTPSPAKSGSSNSSSAPRRTASAATRLSSASI
jgi:excinuclease ABC subunit A